MAVTNDLVTDRRVLRHAETLREAGYEVSLVGRGELKVRCRKKWKFYAEYNLRLWWRLLRTQCDIVWANDTDTLLACWLAVRRKNGLTLHRSRKRRLVMDAHELFPEVPELVGRDRVKHVWECIERHLMPKCDALLTVCRSIAEYYKDKYHVEMAVVRNVGVMNEEPRIKNEEPSMRNGARSLLLYQGAVNLGRGVDWAIDALEFLPECELVVAGDGDLLQEMMHYAESKPWADRIRFTGRLTPKELQRLTPTADVGLVMLEDMGLNYHYALPNRIGDFVAAGVPMVVSDLPEMAAVVRRFGVGEVIEECGGVQESARGKAPALAEAVKKVLAREWSDNDFADARKDMDWNNEKKTLLRLVHNLMPPQKKQRTITEKKTLTYKL